MRFFLLFCLGMIVCLGNVKAIDSPEAAALRFIPARNDTLRHLGRVTAEKDRLGLYWAACGVELTCKTTVLYIEMDSDAPDNYVQVGIDDCFTRPILVHCTPGRKMYKITDSLKPGIHKFTLRRRTDPTTMGCFLYGIWVGDKAELQFTPAKELKIDYYGDSVSSGHGDEAEEGENVVERLYWNPMRAFTGFSAQLLDADYTVISKSGIGLMVSWYDQVIGDIYDLENPHDYKQKYDFTCQPADVVVVNIMQNDSWLISKMNPRPGEADIVKAYVNFVRKLLVAYPQAKIVCALGPMNIVAEGSPWPEYVKRSVAELQKENPERNFSCCFFPYLPTQDHPTVKEQAIAARQLADHIRGLFKM